MIILTIRTDNPQAEVGLYVDKEQLGYFVWTAHRELAETIHQKISQLLKESDKQLSDIDGVVVLEGPGSFTGLRIGISVANALAYGLNTSVVGAQGEDWIMDGIGSLVGGQKRTYVLPEYGAPVFTTKPKK